MNEFQRRLLARQDGNVEWPIRRVWPEATRVGEDVLRDAGWTTQIPSAPDIVVRSGGPNCKLIGFTLSVRPAGWFDQVRRGRLMAPRLHLHRLRAPWALADMISRAMDHRVRTAWLVDPEDLDLEAAAEDPDIVEALATFGLTPVVVTADGYEEVYADWRERQGEYLLRRRALASRPRG